MSANLAILSLPPLTFPTLGASGSLYRCQSENIKNTHNKNKNRNRNCNCSCRCSCGCGMGYLDAQKGASARTAFRTAEKLYKRYKQPSTQLRNSKSRKAGPPTTDVSEVLDMRRYSELLRTAETSNVDGVSLATGSQSDAPVLVLNDHPGFYFIPQALSNEEQFHWIRESLTSFPQPPNRTSHNAVYGSVSDLWFHAQDQHVLLADDEVKEGAANANDSSITIERGIFCQQEVKVHHGPPPPAGAADDGEFINPEKCQDNTRSTSIAMDTGVADDDTPGIPELVFPYEGGEAQKLGNGGEKYSSTARVVHQTLTKENPGGKCWSFVNSDEARRRMSLTAAATSFFKPISAESLLRKLRWATVGIQFDWSQKAYNTNLPFKELSPKLCELASRLAKPAMNGGEYSAQAAIVNFYGPDDMLGGHVDDMEADWSKPIVSISLGCKAVFLLGGTSRSEAPVAMFLRSGDVVLLAGPARHSFHGVPRIFVDPEESDLPNLSAINDPSVGSFMDYIQNSRININVRQVH